MSPLLEISGLVAGYGDLTVLHGIDLKVEAGEVVSVVGANAAGKTTLLQSIAGLLRPREGRVVFDGQDITTEPMHRSIAEGLVLVPEGRRMFPELTVRENLVLGAFHKRARAERTKTLDEVLELFPALASRQDQLAGSMSGGEQQMCALARGLMSRPRMLMLDEPSLGLAPIVVERVFSLIREVNQRDITVLLVEQNVTEALELSQRAYVLEQGRVTTSGPAAELLGDDRVRAAYLGA